MKVLVNELVKNKKEYNKQIKKLLVNRKKISELMESGNKFIISTERSYESVANDLFSNNISFDYLICKNGLVTFNSDNEIVNVSYLSKEKMDNLLDMLNRTNLVSRIKFYNTYNNRLDIKDLIGISVEFNDENCINGVLKNYYINKEFLSKIDGNKVLFSNKYTKKDALIFIKDSLKLEYSDFLFNDVKNNNYDGLNKKETKKIKSLIKKIR